MSSFGNSTLLGNWTNRIGKQTTIEGQEGVNIYVGNNTDLKGSMILAHNENLKLDTGTLSWTDMKSSSKGGSASIGAMHKTNFGKELAAREEEKEKKEATYQGHLEQFKKEVKDGGSPDPSGIRHEDICTEEFPAPQGNTYTDIDRGIQWVRDTTKVVNEELLSWQVRPKDISLEVKYTEQVARATVGPGEISIRDNPNQDISKLNRNPDLAFTESSPLWNGWKINLKDPVKSIDGITQTVEDVSGISDKIANKGFEKTWHDFYEDKKVKVMKEWNKVARFFSKKADEGPAADMSAQHQQ